MNTPCFLYRHFAADGTLLYVGISLNSVVRLSQHKDASPWFAEIARIEIENFESRPVALAAERAAVQAENPKYNKHLRPTRAQRSDLQKLAAEDYTPSLPEKAATKLTSNVVRFGLMYREDQLPLPLSRKQIRDYMDAGELGYFELQNTHCANRGKVRLDRWVSGWQLIDFLEWLSSKRPKAAA